MTRSIGAPQSGQAVSRSSFIDCDISKTDLHYRAKRAGFHSLKRVEKGEYEKMY